jgi:hypothetical protein
MKFSKVHLLAALPLFFALSGCATTEENSAPTSEAPAAVSPANPAAVATPVATTAAASTQEKSHPEHCDNHKRALDAIKHDCVKHCKNAKGKKGKACITHCEHEAISQHNCETHCANNPKKIS